MKTIKTLAILVGICFYLGLVSIASAHLVTFGWTDNGDGSVTLWGEHWHGNLGAPFTDNGGIHIFGEFDNYLADPPLAVVQWVGVQNGTDRVDMVNDGTLTGWDPNTGNPGSGNYDTWMYTAPLAIGNGTYQFFTGTACCVDTMTSPVLVTLSGITSVPPGPPGANPVPEPATVLLFGGGLAGLIGTQIRRRKKLQQQN